jgi:hypothetical protein
VENTGISADALRHFDIALVASIVNKADVEPELMDEHETRTASIQIKQNGRALVTRLFYKFWNSC